MPRPKSLPKILAETPSAVPTKNGPQTDMQAAFVTFYAKSGINGAEAARLAGYSAPKQDAVRLLSLPHIRQAIRNQRDTIIQGDLAKLALETLGQLMTSETTPAAVRHSAARTSLEMAGHLGKVAPDALENRPLGELTISELEKVIADGEKKLKEIFDGAKIVPAKVIRAD